jgi:hypothetical protein
MSEQARWRIAFGWEASQSAGPRTERSGARPRPVRLRHVGVRGLGLESGAAGKLIAVNKPDTAAAQALNQMVRQVAARISAINLVLQRDFHYYETFA